MQSFRLPFLKSSSVLLLPFWLVGAAGAQDPVVIAPRFEPGAVGYVELVQEISQTSKTGSDDGPAKTLKSTRTRGLIQRVESVSPDQTVRLQVTYDRLQAAAESSIGPASFDTDTDQGRATTNPFAAVFRPLLGASFVLEWSAADGVRSCEGMQSAYDRVEEAAAGAALFNQMHEELTDENARLVWGEHRMMLYPPQPVRVGESWTRTVRRRAVYLGDLERAYRCTLESVGSHDGRRVAKVGYEAAVSRPPDAQPGVRISATALTLRSGRIEGTATFDFERGEFVAQSDTMVTLLDGSRSGSKPDETIPVQVETTTKQSYKILTEDERQKQRGDRGRGPVPKPEK